MDDLNYEEKLELKLIRNFKSMFHAKMGYEPIVISRNHKEMDPENKQLADIKAVALPILKNWFRELVPVKEDKKLFINTKKRFTDLVQTRMIYSHVARSMGYSLNDIGKSLDQHHSTVIYSLHTFRDLMETNITFREKYQYALEHLKEKSKNYDPKLLECSNQTQDNDESAILS